MAKQKRGKVSIQVAGTAGANVLGLVGESWRPLWLREGWGSRDEPGEAGRVGQAALKAAGGERWRAPGVGGDPSFAEFATALNSGSSVCCT